jgi:hypothetical protein
MHQPPDEKVRWIEVERRQPTYRKVGAWVLAAVGGAVIAAVLGGLYPRIAWGWPPGFDDPSAIAADNQLRGWALSLEMVLITSQPHRGDLASVSEAIDNCRIWPDYAITQVQSVVDDRQSALEGFKNNPAPAPGVELAQRAFSAYLASLRADTDLIGWLKEVKKNYPGDKPCEHRDDTQYHRYLQDNDSATTAKKQFVAAFNPVAHRFGFAPPNWEWRQF